MSHRANVDSTADAYLELLVARGVEYFIANAGTDFAPIIEAFAKRAAAGQPTPRPVTIPHEVTAVALAHGFAMVTGRPQVVMVHVIVGAANAIGGIMNAARSNVPILFTAGRNPITEHGFAGSRDRPIHGAQESFDQGALAREFVKWDYALVDPAVVRQRRVRWEAEHRRLRAEWSQRGARTAAEQPMEMAWVSRCVGEVVDDQTIVVNEYDLDPTQACFTVPGSYYAASPAGGLGWGLGAALGAKLAAPDRTVIACVGDGAYMFGAPTAAHWVSRAYGLPTLTVIFNNRAWNAVKRSVHAYAKDGWAARSDAMPLTELDPPPDYELVCRASGGFAERVEDPAALPEALTRALRVVRDERRQALLNVIVKKPR